MKYYLPLLFLALASACSTVRPLPATDFFEKRGNRLGQVVEGDSFF